MTRRDWWAGIAVLVAVALLLAWYVPRHMGAAMVEGAADQMQQYDEVQTRAVRDATKAQAGIFAGAIDLFKLHTGTYPSDLKSLLVNSSKVTGWNGPYLNGDAVPLDPWEHDLKFAVPGKHSKGFDVWSMGPDGIDGTSDDIGNWDN